MLDLSPEHFSEPICDVDIVPLLAWLKSEGDKAPWVVQGDNTPQRLHELPYAVQPIVSTVLLALPIPCRADEIVLSRMLPGQLHGMHIDQKSPGVWITRVHVPLLTGFSHRMVGAWLQFEGHELFHLAAGKAYTFNAAHRRHCFGNRDPKPRIHLLFDVLRL